MVRLHQADPEAVCMAWLRSSFSLFFFFFLPAARPQLSHDKSVGAGWQSEDYVIIVGIYHPSRSPVSVTEVRMHKQSCMVTKLMYSTCDMVVVMVLDKSLMCGTMQ